MLRGEKLTTETLRTKGRENSVFFNLHILQFYGFFSERQLISIHKKAIFSSRFTKQNAGKLFSNNYS